MFGFFNLNKPSGITSRDAVNAVQRLVKPAKVGHCGTLDPLASGVLVVCVGPATRLTSFVQNLSKSYIGRFRLGLASNTEDIEGTVVPLEHPPAVSRADIENVLPRFIGQIQQLPPQFSALKVNGKRAYELARRGEQAELKPRPVTVHQLRLADFQPPNFELQIVCGSGTYVRSLGRDIGENVGSAAIMTDLVRTAIGPFSIDQAINADDLDRSCLANRLLLPSLGLINLPHVVLDDRQAAGLINAVPVLLAIDRPAERVVAKDASGRLLAVMQRQADGTFSPKINFSHYWQSLDKPAS